MSSWPRGASSKQDTCSRHRCGVGGWANGAAGEGSGAPIADNVTGRRSGGGALRHTAAIRTRCDCSRQGLGVRRAARHSAPRSRRVAVAARGRVQNACCARASSSASDSTWLREPAAIADVDFGEGRSRSKPPTLDASAARTSYSQPLLSSPAPPRRHRGATSLGAPRGRPISRTPRYNPRHAGTHAPHCPAAARATRY